MLFPSNPSYKPEKNNGTLKREIQEAMWTVWSD